MIIKDVIASLQVNIQEGRKDGEGNKDCGNARTSFICIWFFNKAREPEYSRRVVSSTFFCISNA